MTGTFKLSLLALALVCLAGVPAAALADDAAKPWLTAMADETKAPAPTATTAPAPTSAPASAPAETAAPAAWPPGLLMDGLDAIGVKKAFDALGLRTWGFVETGFMGRLTGGQDPLPGRLLDARRVNNLRLDQLRLTIDRPYDTSKQFDIGGRVDLLYGGDAMLTHALGLNEMGDGQGENWFDLEQFYGQAWFKTGKDSGLEIMVGRFFGPTGYESTDAALSPLYSHGYLYNTMGPFTTTGAKATYFFNSQWSAYFGVINGWDDFRDNNHAHSFITGGAWASADQLDGHARATAGVNVITGPEQTMNVNNYRTLVDGVFTYWWTNKLSQTLQADYLTEEQASYDGGVARSYGLAHYLSYIFNDNLTGIWRAEWYRDDTGVRTGTQSASWYEMTWGVNVTPWPADRILKNLMFRPEFRWDFADQPVFGGGRENQLTLGMDAIFKF